MLIRIRPITSLVNEILDRLPDSAWTDPDIRFLDPAMGGGQFVAEIERRLLARGHSKENIADRVFGFEYNLGAVHLAVNLNRLRGIPMVGKYSKLSYTDYCSKAIGMKFDVIVGNPPYDLTSSKKIWPDFIKKSLVLLETGGTVALVSPSSWLNSNGSVYRNVRIALTSTFNLTTVSRDANGHFKDVGIDICYWVATHEPYTGLTNYITNSNSELIDLRSGMPTDADSQYKDLLIKKIIGKGPGIKWIINDKGNRKVATNELVPEQTSTHTFKTYQSTSNIGYLDRDIGDFGKLKLAVNYSSAFYNSKAADFNMPITTDNIGSLMGYVLVNSQAEGEQLRSYLCSKVIRWLVANYKKQNTGFSDAVKRCIIPQVPFKTWSDADAYNYFNLTQEEIDYIEQHI